MRRLRFILDVIVGLALVFAPVGSAMASAAMTSTMTHATAVSASPMDMADCHKAPAKKASESCPCCDKSNMCRSGTCGGNCVKIDANASASVLGTGGAGRTVARLEPTDEALPAWPPPSPPPRI